METSRPRIVLIARPEAERDFYLSFLAPFHDEVEVEWYEGVTAFRRECSTKAYVGFIVELRTLIKSTNIEKVFFSKVGESFPVLRVRSGPEPGQFSGLMEGGPLRDLNGPELLERFIRTVCLKTMPRGIRGSDRLNVVLSVLLHDVPNAEKPIRAIVHNISETGCFVVSPEDFHSGDIIGIEIRELSDRTAIPSEICWVQPWGQDLRNFPGFGARYLHMTPEQETQIGGWLRGE